MGDFYASLSFVRARYRRVLVKLSRLFYWHVVVAWTIDGHNAANPMGMV